MSGALAEPGRISERTLREVRPGLSIMSTGKGAFREFQLMLYPLAGESVLGLVERLRDALEEVDAAVVRHEVFAGASAQEETRRALLDCFGDFDWPVTWSAGTGTGRVQQPIGMQIFAVSGVPVDTMYLKGRPLGRTFDNGDARHCILAGLQAERTSVSAQQQYHSMFEELECALEKADMQPRDLVRTWFSLQDILSWYDSFNAVRNEIFRRWSQFEGILPASTGIGMENAAKAAVVAGAWAVQPRPTKAGVQEVDSPLQNPSLKYGSAFSRAVAVPSPLGRRLLVSGTASIALDGRSLHEGDAQSQIQQTIEVVEELLTSGGGSLQDVIRATAYFKEASDMPLLETCLVARGSDKLPCAAVQADICRPELLFEIELDAWV